MAYLLGAAAVMESLQTDVRDVQSCVMDIVSRTGPVQSTSWKFPDKSASDLDIEDLLDLYSYSDDEEERQVAHIALYELVIDRLVLLLHTMSSFTEGILKSAKVDTEWGHISGTSVGVISKKYWSRLSQLHQVVKHTVQEKNAMSRKVLELEGDVKRLDLELKQSYSSQRPKTAGFGGLIPPNRAEMVAGLSLNPAQLKEFGLISKDEYNKSCQTSETAFTPCDSCSVVQKSFRQCGEIVVAICQQQQIPSCLQKFRPQVSHLDWLSGNDVTRWAAEQHKDLQRISKLTATIKPLKDELTECREKSEKLEKRVQNFDRDLKREKDDRTALHKEYELKIKELQSQHRQTLELEQQQKDLLEKNKHELESLLEKRKSELEEKQLLLKEMECTKAKLEEELSGNKINTSEVSRLQKEMSNLQGKLDDVAVKMDVSAKDLQREQAKNKSVAKHTQSLQSKQEALLIRIEVLDEENKDLKDQLSEMEEEKDKIEESLNECKRETTQLERKMKENKADMEHVLADKESLEQSITTLETTVESLNDKLEEAKERERLIVGYPDINGPVNPDISGTGDILLDMENQIRANIVRIQLLETQNDGLRNSVRKLQAMQQEQPEYVEEEDNQRWATHVNVKKGRPKPLWEPSSVQHKENNMHGNEPEYSYMENTYNQSSSKTPGMFDTQSTHSAQHQNHSMAEHSSKNRNHSAVHNIEFDNSAVKKSSPSKDRPAFGHRPLSGKKKQTDEFIVGHAVRPDSVKIKKENTFTSTGKSRPSSGKFMAPVNTNSISAYLQLKKAGKLNLPHSTGAKSSAGSRPTTGGKAYIPTADVEDNYIRKDNFMCQNCDKMYDRQRDLDIHMSYCTG
ncbi:coiled-coil domain-containing protein 157-like isoform X2 [Mercenaria mercenaria]|nr:coiled-coil domain-containing protein 157-like isoform X2 [Mercenaria mercenaria]XP_045171609.2 coiled-coil domain-containing protein 157-like isoform X2 [Mercenaria mercenaria]